MMAGSAKSQTCTLQISGHVEDSDIKQKLSGASVTILETNQTQITDEKGDFKFSNICAGSYTIQITHVSCDTLIKKISLNKSMHTDYFMPHSRKVLDEVFVQSERATQNTGFKKELSAKELKSVRGLSLGETLARLEGITTLQTGSTISKPVIHGLHGNRVLMINNGVRQEGQQWGNEHAPEIDPFIADKLTVIKGVDELRYGSDAIGGVILVQPKSLRFSPGINTNWQTGFSSNNLQYYLSGAAEFTPEKNNKLAFRIHGTIRKSANVNTPDYRLNNTAMQEIATSFTAASKHKNFRQELFYSFYATKLGVFAGSHIGNLTDLLIAIESDKPNDVFLGESSYKIGRPRQEVAHHLAKWKGVLEKNGHTLQTTVAAQFNTRKEFDVVRNNTNQPQLTLDVNTFSQDIIWEQPAYKGFRGTAGISFSQQFNRYNGRYFIPNYNAYTLGGFYLQKWKRHKWDLQAGVRYDHKRVETFRMQFGGISSDHDFSFNTLAGSFNTSYKPKINFELNGGISIASRAPYVNELLSNGLHHGTASFERGDIDLDVEKSANINIGANYKTGNNKLELSFLLYSNFIRDFIYRVPKPDSPMLTISGAYPLIVYDQTDARLDGADAKVAWKISPSFTWENKASLLYAHNRTTKDWLIGMPANRYTSALTYALKDFRLFKENTISIEIMHTDKQHRVPNNSDITDYKTPPDEYQLVNFYAGTIIELHQLPISVSISVRNLLNNSYRDYLNSMRYFTDEAGINASLNLSIPLTIKTK